MQLKKKKNQQPNQKVSRRPKYTFHWRRHTDGQEAHEKRCSTSVIIREMQIKTTMKLTPHTNQNGHHQKKSTNNKCWRGCGERGTLLDCWGECKLIQPLWKTVWRFLKKLKTELPYDPAILLLGIYPEKTIIQKDTCNPMFTGILLNQKNKWNWVICGDLDGSRIYHTEWSKSEKKIKPPIQYINTYIWNLEKR